MRYAVFKNVLLDFANLEGADLRDVEFDHADLRCADLQNAKLNGSRNWLPPHNTKIAFANIRGIRDNDAFVKWAKDQLAVDSETSDYPTSLAPPS